jgi:hypothetical protein
MLLVGACLGRIQVSQLAASQRADVEAREEAAPQREVWKRERQRLTRLHLCALLCTESNEEGGRLRDTRFLPQT